jgi:hypothetical protein
VVLPLVHVGGNGGHHCLKFILQGAVYDANCKYLTRNISEFQRQRYTMFLSLFIGNTVKYFGSSV